MKKRIAILGSTGSIGVQALDIVNQYNEYYEITALSANKNISLLAEQVDYFQPSHIGIADEDSAEEFKRFGLKDVKILRGNTSLTELATLPEVDIVVMAVVGIAGLEATIAALEAGKNVALANKETLVAGGQIVMNAAKKTGSKIIPVDSEHSAIFQCLFSCNNSKELDKVYLTASGGPFKGYDQERLKRVTVAEALNHPNWEMGKKITVDSATLMNKGLEVIEARWLFDLSIEQIEVIIHPQSIIHSMIEFIDGTIIAQMGKTDMRLPILYALSYPERLPTTLGSLNLAALMPLTFEEPDVENFPCLTLAYKALRIGGTMPVVLNASNEIAVEKFLREEISFMEIPIMVQEAMKSHQVIQNPDIHDILRVDQNIRKQLT